MNISRLHFRKGWSRLRNVFRRRRPVKEIVHTPPPRKVLPAVDEPSPDEPEESPPNSPELTWRYNLSALEETLKEKVSTGIPFPDEETTPAKPTLNGLAALDPDEVRKKIEDLHQIPVLKSVSQSFQLASRDQNANLSELSSLVSRDPGLHAKILRMINASFFRMEREVTDIEHAMILLGLDRIRFMAQTLGAVQELNKISTGFDLRHLWSHSFSCGLLSEYLAQTLQLPDLIHAYSAGLLHDVGKIILSSLFPDHYRSILRLSPLENFDLIACEQEVFGCDHEEAGKIFAEKQRLPKAIATAMSFHSKPLLSPIDEQDTACVLFLANDLAKRHHLGFSGNPRLATDEETIACLQRISSVPLANYTRREDTLNFLDNLRKNVVWTLPQIHKEIDGLLRMTFGRSAPLNLISKSA